MTIPEDRTQAIDQHAAVLMYHETATGSFEVSVRIFAELWEDLVPERGQASSMQGEILRAVGRLAGEDRRNGCVNWDSYYDELVEFLRTSLPNERVFARAVREDLEGFGGCRREWSQRHRLSGDSGCFWEAHRRRGYLLPSVPRSCSCGATPLS